MPSANPPSLRQSFPTTNNRRWVLLLLYECTHLRIVAMIDPLSDVIALLRPRAVFAKSISGAESWGVRYSQWGKPSFCVVMEGSCRLAIDGQDAVTLKEGDFVLLPTTPGFVLSSLDKPARMLENRKPTAGPSGDVRHGSRRAPMEVRGCSATRIGQRPG